MLFSKHHFTHFNNQEVAQLIADICNETITKNSVNVTGRVYESGDFVDFSNTKIITDTHTGLLIDVQPMGRLKPMKSAIKQNAADVEYMLNLTQGRNKDLEKLLNMRKE